MFGEKAAPNHHKLAREFVLLDNFYVNADVSADGHNWATAAIAPITCRSCGPTTTPAAASMYDFEGGEPAASPPAGYFWTNAPQRGVSMRNYGYWVANKKNAGADGVQMENVRDPVLAQVTNMKYRSFDLDYPDVESRAKCFWRTWRDFEKSGNDAAR